MQRRQGRYQSRLARLVQHLSPEPTPHPSSITNMPPTFQSSASSSTTTLIPYPASASVDYPPPFPEGTLPPTSVSCSLANIEFGTEVRQSIFQLTPSTATCLLNHGSYGSVPSVVATYRDGLRRQCEQNPDTWFRHTVQPMMESLMQKAARCVNADPENMALLTNATTCANAVFRSLERAKVIRRGSTVLVLDIVYGSVLNTAQETCKFTGASLQILQVPLPLSSPTDIVTILQRGLQAFPDTCLVVLDHIASATALTLPVKELISAVRERERETGQKVYVFVDGAHAVGQLRLDLPALGADFYCSNFHKWAFTPRGTAFLWAHPTVADLLISPITGKAWKDSRLPLRLSNQGTRDMTQFLALDRALQFISDLGVQKAHGYRRRLLLWAAGYLKARWGTEDGGICPASMHSGYMFVIRTPLRDNSYTQTMEQDPMGQSAGAQEMFQKLHQEYNVVVPVMSLRGSLYVRISAQVYNSKWEYHRLAEVVEELSRK